MADALASAASAVTSPIASVFNAVLPSDTGVLGPVRGGVALVGGIFIGQAIDTLALKAAGKWGALPYNISGASGSLLKASTVAVAEAMVAILMLEVSAGKMTPLHTTVFAIALIPQLNFAEMTAQALWGKAESRL